MPTPITPTDLGASTTSAWTDMDVSSYVTGNPAAVILHVNNSSASARTIGLRKNGSTDNRTVTYKSNGHHYAVVGLDGSNIFEYWISGTEVDLYIVGSLSSDDYVAFTNAVDKTPSGTSGWQDCDISSDTGANTAIAVEVELVASTGSIVSGIRCNGSTDARTNTYLNQIYQDRCKVDASEIFEAYRATSNPSYYVVGYYLANSTWNTNATDYSLGTTGSYVDLSALPSGAIMGIFEISSSLVRAWDIRKNGASTDFSAQLPIQNQSSAIVECDGSQLVEGSISATQVDFWLRGYFTAAAGGNTAEPGNETHSHIADGVAIVQAHKLTIGGATHGHVADPATGTQVHTLSIGNASHAHEAGAVTTAQSHTVVVGDSSHGHLADGVTVAQAHAVEPADEAHSHVSDTASLAQVHFVSVGNASHAHLTTSPTFGQFAVVSDAIHSHQAEAATVTQSQSLTIGNATHGHVAGQSTLSQTHTIVAGSDIHGHVADESTVSQTHRLTVTDEVHGHSVTLPTFLNTVAPVASIHQVVSETASLIQAQSLHPDSVSHVQLTGAVTLSQVHAVSAAGAAHAHTVDTAALTQVHALVIGDAVHAHLADAVTVSIAAVTIEPADASHDHSVTSPTLGHVLMVSDATHSHSAVLAAVVQGHVLIGTAANHSHIADGATLAQTHRVTVGDATHSILSDIATLILTSEIVIADAGHAHAVGAASISQTHNLSVQDAINAHLADTATLAQIHALVIANAAHVIVDDGALVESIGPGPVTLNTLTFDVTGRDALFPNPGRTITNVVTDGTSTQGGSAAKVVFDVSNRGTSF